MEKIKMNFSFGYRVKAAIPIGKKAESDKDK